MFTHHNFNKYRNNFLKGGHYIFDSTWKLRKKDSSNISLVKEKLEKKF